MNLTLIIECLLNVTILIFHSIKTKRKKQTPNYKSESPHKYKIAVIKT